MQVGVLDQSPVHDGESHARALERTIELSQHCESLGYNRYWLAEHHAFAPLGSACPEVMVSHVAQQTQAMRVGSGGVLLPNYSAYKVAETFNTIACLHPGRIDVGVGCAEGQPAIQQALSHPRRPNPLADYDEMVVHLSSYLGHSLEVCPPLALPVNALSSAVPKPEFWVLCSGPANATLAGQVGAGLGLALFIGGQDKPLSIVDDYRRAFRPSGSLSAAKVLLAVCVICADTQADACHLGKSHARAVAGLSGQGLALPLVAPESIAVETLLPAEQAHYHRLLDSWIMGTPEQCATELYRLETHYGADEIMIVTVTYSYAARKRSYELLADVLQLGHPDIPA